MIDDRLRAVCDLMVASVRKARLSNLLLRMQRQARRPALPGLVGPPQWS